jgi:hypothetical protein
MKIKIHNATPFQVFTKSVLSLIRDTTKYENNSSVATELPEGHFRAQRLSRRFAPHNDNGVPAFGTSYESGSIEDAWLCSSLTG